MKKQGYVILLSLAVILIGGIMTLVSRLTVKKFDIPYFIGNTKSEVTAWVEENSIPADRVLFVYHDSDQPEDTVIWQNLYNTKLPNDVNLVIRLSTGTDLYHRVEIPDFTGQTRADVESWFKEQGLTNITYKEQFRTDLASGTFISISPEAGTRVTIASEIDVTVATDDDGKHLIFPDFTGSQLEEIQAWADAHNIYTVFNYEWSADIAVNEYIRADISPGDVIERGSTINFWIAFQ